MHSHPPSIAYVYLTAIAVGTAAVCWITRREVGRVRVEVEGNPGSASSPPARRTMVARNGRLLALAEPVPADAVERRRLLEAHLRDQFAGELEEIKKTVYAKGYADGVARRQAN